MREVVLDTETTGLDPSAGHRIVEVGAVELVNHIPSGRRFQRYLDPERDMPEGAERVHGLTRDFLAKQKRFAEEADAILEFIGDARLVMHNAPFDLGFLNAELERIERPRSRRSGRWTRWSSRAASIRARRRAWMRSASASGSTAPCARSTAPCSTPSCSPTSTWSSPAAASRRSACSRRRRRLRRHRRPVPRGHERPARTRPRRRRRTRTPPSSPP